MESHHGVVALVLGHWRVFRKVWRQFEHGWSGTGVGLVTWCWTVVIGRLSGVRLMKVSDLSWRRRRPVIGSVVIAQVRGLSAVSIGETLTTD